MTCYRVAETAVFVLLLALTVAAPSHVWSQAGTITKGMQNNCANDYKKYCGDYGLQTALIYVGLRVPGRIFTMLPIGALIGALLSLGNLAVHRELVPGLDEELGGFEQRLRGNAARVGAGAAENRGAVLVLPFVDAGHLELVLRRANRRGITRRTATDDDHIVFSCQNRPLASSQTPSSSRAGSSRPSLMATRNCTASRPSMMRWS